MSNYREFSLPEFLRVYPSFAPQIIRLGLDITDPEYIVRVSERGLEIGYPSDDWLLSPQKKGEADAAPKVGARSAHSPLN